MYHPSRGGVRGGRDQFSWDDVKVDKHRENYLGHSIKAPVGRWQKGKDLHWYTRDKKSEEADLKEEIQRIKEEEEQAMREALGLAPKRSSRPQGNRLDKHEYAELIKRGSTAEDLGGGHAEAAQVQGLGLYKVPHNQQESSFPAEEQDGLPGMDNGEALREPTVPVKEEIQEEESSRKKRKHDERRHEKEKKRDKHEKKRSHDSRDKYEKKRTHDSDDRRKHRKDKGKRHDSE